MQNSVLGKLEENNGSVIGSLSIGGLDIPIRIDPDDASLDQTISLAVTIATLLPDYDRTSKDIIVRDLLDTYNSGWNEYYETQEDGSYKEVVNPEINADEFRASISMSSISITGNSCVDIYYDAGKLFWGHGICVTSLNGANFSSSKARLVG
ncbi:MAG: DUF2262 domain-containing protein [Pseudomonadales bacterium]|jgi:hypothetical protein|nr:DUF2262 domain-containing protein [Pseudomonadales bacterium]